MSYRVSQLKSFLEDVLWCLGKFPIEEPVIVRAIIEETLIEAREVIRLSRWSQNLETLLETPYNRLLESRAAQGKYSALQIQRLWHDAEWRT
jgi:hypothetical protein